MSKYVILQMSANMLKLTPITRKATKYQYGIPVPFVLPSILVGGDFAQNIFNFAEFSNACLKKMHLNKAKIIICLDDDNVISKKFSHYPAKSEVLQKTARLEAESVLPEGFGDFFVETYTYSEIPDADKKLQSILYCAPADLIVNIKKQFKRYGLKVIRIAPSICGLVSAGRSLLSLLPENNEIKGKVVAMVDLGFEKIGLAMFNDGEPFFERSFESVYDDIINIVCNVRGVSLEGAQRQLRTDGLMKVAGANKDEQKQINLLIESACGEVIRNIRVVLSSERLELDKIVFCGAFTSLPHFDEFLKGLSLDIPNINIADFPNFSKHNIELESKTAGIGFSAGDFFSTSGLIMRTSYGEVNFLHEPNRKKSDTKATAMMLTLLTLLLMLAMTVEPLIYTAALIRNKYDENRLVDTRYDEGKQLKEKEIELQKKLDGLQNDKNLLPYEKSKATEVYKNVLYKITPNVLKVDSMTYDNNGGFVALNFVTVDFNSYLSIRNKIMDDKFFFIAVPFSATQNKETGEYSCSVTLSVNGFEPFPEQVTSSDEMPAESEGDK